MARKGLFGAQMGKDAFYFGHDINARNDVKMRALRREAGGWAAYGLVWALIEYSGEQSDYRIELDLQSANWQDCSGWLALSEEFGIDLPTARKLIDCCLKNRLAYSGLDANALRVYLTILNLKESELSTRSFIFFPTLIRKRKVAELRRNAANVRWSLRNDAQKIDSKSISNRFEEGAVLNNSIGLDANALLKRKGKERKIKESKEEKESVKEKVAVAPIHTGCEFFRIAESEFTLVQNRFKLNGYPLELIPYAIQAVDGWLAGDTPKAIKQRAKPTHYRQLYAAWVIERAAQMHKAMGNGNGNGHKQQGRNYYPTAYERRMEREERLKLELAELDRKESEQHG